MNADESSWRAFVERHGDDPDHEVQTAVLLITALLRKYPPSLHAPIMSKASALLADPASNVETAVASAGPPGVGERFARTVNRIVRQRSS